MSEGKPVAKIGNVTRTPELKFSKGGNPYTKFGLAETPYTPKGAPKAPTAFYDVTAFGKLAEHVAQCVGKGDRVLVIGVGQVTTYNGTERREIIADGVGHDLRFVTSAISKDDGQQQLDGGEEF